MRVQMTRWSLALSTAAIILLASCSQPINKTTQGAIAGTALGAGTGAIIGSATGKAGVGTAIGAGIGALGGAMLGNSMDRIDEENSIRDQQLAENQRQIDENARLIEELKSRGADVRSSQRGVVINLPDILFDFDRSTLTPEARRTVGEISDVIRKASHRKISVEGHTDSIGSVKYNKQLSENRARSVSSELHKNNIPASRIKVRGYGEGNPIATNNTEAGRARNRRVEIIIEN